MRINKKWDTNNTANGSSNKLTLFIKKYFSHVHLSILRRFALTFWQV